MVQRAVGLRMLLGFNADAVYPQDRGRVHAYTQFKVWRGLFQDKVHRHLPHAAKGAQRQVRKLSLAQVA